MNYMSDRWGDKVGTRRWVAPFIKGQGMLIKKRHDIEKREGGSDAVAGG